ncbi:MAG: hypothetical protein V3R60_00130, partial [Acidobacteriota bacterium]
KPVLLGVVLEVGDAGEDLLLNELFRRMRDHPLLIVQVLGGKDLFRAAGGDQKAAAFEPCRDRGGRTTHVYRL